MANLLGEVAEKLDAQGNQVGDAGNLEEAKLLDATAKAFDFAQDVTKQVLTLSTAIVALTLTFYKNFASHNNHSAEVIMGCSWLIYLISVLFGLLTLMALTGTLQPRSSTHEGPTIQNANIRTLASLQVLFFFIALILSVCAGIITL